MSLARRYARALLNASGANADASLEQLEALVAVWGQSPELQDLAQNPAYGNAQRAAFVTALSAQSKLSAPVANLLRLLMERGRMVSLPDIARAFRDLVDLRLGRLRATVTSARALPEDVAQHLVKALEAATSKKVSLDLATDAKLIGGVSAQLGSTVYDASLKTQLQLLARQLNS